ncbi:cupin domain-containing protein [Kitasatospora sp. NPDC058218]|uniref:cupin domain-containing protein n=1 Tax=Kitasatospora sp. NPDC058218 TaxID=3346385 RepID=UPI0036DA3C63
MNRFDVPATAAVLPQAWRSRVLGRVGTAAVKVLRMDGLPLEEERHEHAEALLVFDGRLHLLVAGADVPLGPGELYVVAAGVPHAVAAGSRGTLVIVEVDDDASVPA